jgi:antimicrobial peptide system SdpB family protein
VLTSARRTLLVEVASFNPFSFAIAVGRSILALAQASVLVFTPTDALFVPVGDEPQGAACSSLASKVGAYCALEDVMPRSSVSLVVLAGLIVVASGFLPRYISWVHYWLTLSLSTSITLPDGGEAVMQCVAFLLIFICAPDGRWWQWRSAEREAGSFGYWIGVAWAGHWFLRLQMAFIYFNSGIAKLSVSEWSDGTALFYILRGENFGSQQPWSAPLIWLSATPVGALGLTWGIIFTEVMLAIGILSKSRIRQRVSLVTSVAIHIGIALFLGIFSFALVMVGAVVVATSRTWVSRTLEGGSRGDEATPDEHRIGSDDATRTLVSDVVGVTPAEREGGARSPALRR